MMLKDWLNVTLKHISVTEMSKFGGKEDKSYAELHTDSFKSLIESHNKPLKELILLTML